MYEKTRFQTTGVSVRGFGYIHDGSIKDLFTFLEFPAFNFQNDDDQRDVEAFLLCFDTGTHAGIGAQWTMDGTNESAGIGRVNALVTQADLGNVGLVAKGRDGIGNSRGWVYEGSGWWKPDKANGTFVGLGDLLDLAGQGTEVTFTAVVPGWQTRMGVDRDEDSFLDRDEIEAGSDPGDPLSIPSTVGVGDDVGSREGMAGIRVTPNPARGAGTRMTFTQSSAGPVQATVFDVNGRKVRTLFRDHRPAGRVEAFWDLRDDLGRRVNAGVFFIEVRLPTASEAQRVLVLP